MDKEKKLFRPFNIEVKASDDTKREITAVGSKEVSDRDGDVVSLDGMNLKNFKKNPVVLWSHLSSELPIGKATKTWVENKELKFKIKFAEPEINAKAESVYQMIKGGMLNSLSIGFSPDWESAKFNEKRGGYDFPKSELLEVSIVNVGANQGARVIERSLAKAFEAGIIDEVEKKDFELSLEDKTEDKVVDVVESEPDYEKRIKDLEKEVDFLKNEIKNQPEVEITPAEQPAGDIHIVDQLLTELFEESDDKSSDSSDKDSRDEDLNSIFEELE